MLSAFSLLIFAVPTHGYLHGVWIKANQDADALYVEVQTMLANSPMDDAELFEIYDYQGFGALDIHKNTSLDEIAALSSLISFIHEQGITSYKHWNRSMLRAV